MQSKKAKFAICCYAYSICVALSVALFIAAHRPHPGANMILVFFVYLLPPMGLSALTQLILSFRWRSEFSRWHRIIRFC